MRFCRPLTKAEQAKIDKFKTGLYGKFHIERTDGRSALGEKHEHCNYFVLDITHDKYAKDALLAYAKACEGEYPFLADDLRMTVLGKAII